MTAKIMRQWLVSVGAKTVCIESGIRLVEKIHQAQRSRQLTDFFIPSLSTTQIPTHKL